MLDTQKRYACKTLVLVLKSATTVPHFLKSSQHAVIDWFRHNQSVQ